MRQEGDVESGRKDEGYQSSDSAESASTTARLQSPNSEPAEYGYSVQAENLERPVKSLLSAFASLVYLKILTGDQTSANVKVYSQRPTLFCGSQKSNICIKKYVERIAVHSKCSPICFAGAFVYLQRLAQKDDEYALCSRSVHRLLITGVLIAAKLLDDKFYSNSFYARIGGISTRELNQLELEMLKLLEFRAFVSPRELGQAVAFIFEATAEKSAFGEAHQSRSCCHGRKRVNDSNEATGEALQPTKLQHDDQRDQILVTMEARNGRSNGDFKASEGTLGN